MKVCVCVWERERASVGVVVYVLSMSLIKVEFSVEYYSMIQVLNTEHYSQPLWQERGQKETMETCSFIRAAGKSFKALKAASVGLFFSPHETEVLFYWNIDIVIDIIHFFMKHFVL